jgi:1-acyl-sn-glycerol-3-phosphate acyltransferase
VNVIFIDRKKRSDTLRVNDHIEQALSDGEGVIMFAESTTSRGTEVCSFKTALFEAAARNNFPVHCAAIHYDAPPGSPPASEWITWWTPISFGAHVCRVLRQRGLNAKLSFGETPISGRDRKLLAEQTRAAVQALFEPVD